MQKIYFEVENLKNRPEVIEKIIDTGSRTILDIGGSWNTYLKGYVTHTFDLFDPKIEGVHWFKGNINSYESWKPIFEYVEEHGKFDFVNCTHVLEDLAYPEAALQYMPRVAKRGFIAVPSKYWELQRRDLMRGGHHHRWIMDNRDNVLTLWPKINLIEYLVPYDEFQPQINLHATKELRMFWEDTIDYKIVNNDYLGPTFENVIDYYCELVHNNNI